MTDGLKTLGQGVVSGIGAAGGTWVLAKFLEAVGLGKFADVLCPVCHMIDQLDAIAAQVTVVKGLVEKGIQATEQSQYNQLVASVAPIDGDISELWDRMRYEAEMPANDPTLKNYNADLVATIGKQLVVDRNAVQELNKALAPSTPLAYGILQAASAYLGSRKPFFTQASSNGMQAVFAYYQLMQLRLSVLLTNYYSTRPDTFSPTTIKDTVIDRITDDIAGQQTLVKPPLPPGTFIDLRTDKNPTLLMWGPVTWVNGKALEHYCVDQNGTRHRFFVRVSQLTCDPPGHDSARVGTELATESQFKALLDGWDGTTPLAWLQKETGLTMTAAPDGTNQNHVGFYWVGRPGTPANRAGPVEGPFCKTFCFDDNTLGMYEYIHRYDMQDTSKPSPDAWTTSLGDYDPQNYNANAVRHPSSSSRANTSGRSAAGRRPITFRSPRSGVEMRGCPRTSRPRTGSEQRLVEWRRRAAAGTRRVALWSATMRASSSQAPARPPQSWGCWSSPCRWSTRMTRTPQLGSCELCWPGARLSSWSTSSSSRSWP